MAKKYSTEKLEIKNKYTRNKRTKETIEDLNYFLDSYIQNIIEGYEEGEGRWASAIKCHKYLSEHLSLEDREVLSEMIRGAFVGPNEAEIYRLAALVRNKF